MVMNQPKAIIFAGANASGKSTFVSTLYQNGVLHGEFINPDKILKEDLKLPETLENYQKAFVIAEERRSLCVTSRQDMVIETVYSTQDKIDFVQELKDQGYQITMIFTGVESVQINALYLVDRVGKGGHDVPIKKLMERRIRSFENVKKSLHLFDCAIFIDNSIMGESPVILKSIAMGGVCYAGDTDREVTWLDLIIDEKISRIDQEFYALSGVQEHLYFCETIKNTVEEKFINTTEMSYSAVNAAMGNSLFCVTPELDDLNSDVAIPPQKK
jgi:predicted ABC-type ATPase